MKSTTGSAQSLFVFLSKACNACRFVCTEYNKQEPQSGMETVSVGSTRPHVLYQKIYREYALSRSKKINRKPSSGKNCATLHIINPRGYTQICVGLLTYMENGRESPVRFRQNYMTFKYFECENNFLGSLHFISLYTFKFPRLTLLNCSCELKHWGQLQEILLTE